MTKNNQLPALINDLSVATIEKNYEDMVARSGRAAAALAKVTEINSDEEDDKAEQLLVKVRATFNYIEGVRKGITGPLDDIKKMLMEPEKTITNAANSGNEYDRVKKLRDAYANKKFREEQERQAKIEQHRKIESAKAAVKSTFRANYTEGLVKANIALNAKLSEAFQSVTPGTMEALKNRLSKGVKLSDQTYADWFDPNKTVIDPLVSFTDAKAIAEELMKEITYDVANDEYLKIARPTFESWTDRLPELEKSMAEDAEKAAEATKAMALKAEQEERERSEKALAEAGAKAKAEAQAEQLQVEFKSQIEKQAEAIETKGRVKRRAIIEADTQDFVAVISELFFNVFVHPKYAGVLKRDKKGVVQLNADGSPVYVDWLQGLLDFYATNCDEPIPGIKIVEEVVTTQRSK